MTVLHEERTANILINKAGGNTGPDAKGYRVEKAEDLLPILEDAFQQKVPCIIDCPVDYSENTKLSEYLHDKFEK